MKNCNRNTRRRKPLTLQICNRGCNRDSQWESQYLCAHTCLLRVEFGQSDQAVMTRDGQPSDFDARRALDSAVRLARALQSCMTRSAFSVSEIRAWVSGKVTGSELICDRFQQLIWYTMGKFLHLFDNHVHHLMVLKAQGFCGCCVCIRCCSHGRQQLGILFVHAFTSSTPCWGVPSQSMPSGMSLVLSYSKLDA